MRRFYHFTKLFCSNRILQRLSTEMTDQIIIITREISLFISAEIAFEVSKVDSINYSSVLMNCYGNINVYIDSLGRY